MRQVLIGMAVASMLGIPLTTGAQIRAFSVPISADRVVLEVQAPDAAPATLYVRNGETARVARVGTAPIGLTPVLRDRGTDLIVVQILVDARTGNEGLRQLARHKLIRGVPIHVADGDPAVEVTWLRTEPPAAAAPDPSNPCTTCCVICDNYLYCGCVVVTECGYCCCPTACPCPFEPDLAGGGSARNSAAAGCAAGFDSAGGSVGEKRYARREPDGQRVHIARPGSDTPKCCSISFNVGVVYAPIQSLTTRPSCESTIVRGVPPM